MEYQGNKFELYDIINKSTGKKVSATSLTKSSNSLADSCYKESIINPSPFMGNHDEIFELSNGTIWKVQYEYEYLYEYYTSVIVCTTKNYIIIDWKELSVSKIR